MLTMTRHQSMWGQLSDLWNFGLTLHAAANRVLVDFINKMIQHPWDVHPNAMFVHKGDWYVNAKRFNKGKALSRAMDGLMQEMRDRLGRILFRQGGMELVIGERRVSNGPICHKEARDLLAQHDHYMSCQILEVGKAMNRINRMVASFARWMENPKRIGKKKGLPVSCWLIWKDHVPNKLLEWQGSFQKKVAPGWVCQID